VFLQARKMVFQGRFARTIGGLTFALQHGHFLLVRNPKARRSGLLFRLWA
jgi:hypothetical protein